MARLSLLVLCLVAAVASAHPMEKVIELLKGLKTTAETEGKQEEVTYTKFEYWAMNSVKSLQKSIAEEKAAIENLESEISSHKKNIAVLMEEIEKLDEQLMELDNEAGAAKQDRDAGKALYQEEKASLEDTIKAIDEATKILKSTRSDTDTGFLQARTKVQALLALIGYRASSEQRGALQAFVAQPKERPDFKAEGDEAKHVKGYAFKSDTVIELLKGLSLKFQDELIATEEAETNAMNASELAKLARGNLIKAKKDSKKTKEDEMASSEEDLTAAEAAHTSTSDDLAADSKSLSETESAWSTKKSEWEERSSTRSKEIEAIETAISILAKVTGVRILPPGNPVPPPSPVALLQLGNPRAEQALRILRQEAKVAHSKALERLADDVTERVKHGDGAFDQVINSIQKMIFLLMNEQKAKVAHSKALERLADDVTERVKHGDGAFDQVINSIQKMIFLLMNEQKEENEHKQWCDLEISKTESSIKDKSEKVDDLTLKIDDDQARAAKLNEEVKAADEMVGKITAHMNEAAEIRQIGKKENKLAVKDAEDAQTALANAIAVLKDFYKSSGGMSKEAWEFVQAPVTLPDTPSTWDSGYTSVTYPAAQPDGIVSVLEKVSADFAQMESQTLAQEESDQEAFEEDIKDCKIEMARRSSESEQKAAEEKRTLEKKRQMEATRKSVSGEKEATETYMKDLQPACVEGSSTYEDRKAARAQEVEALKEAQGLLQKAFEEKLEEKPAAFLRKRSSAAVGALRMDEPLLALSRGRARRARRRQRRARRVGDLAARGVGSARHGPVLRVKT
eukprot:CAMPEP_0183601030 /NCGR_PEP_ID=MMETSP0371-20130417/180232_1 /TAXON_ID=268820 /ORGANISM="Peridinium aciculiferum, Strain PAER-2" /LENGTH=798 /DNA_ID=CAMNT_0025813113 /DNA_START=76 /DNA_END=2470 /DNA_ORIENTATION=+